MIEQTLAQDALPDHARRSEENHFHLTVSYFSRRRVPQRVRRPAATGKALGLIPLVKAGWADAARVEGIPLVPAGAEPFVFFAGRPAAQRAADARRLRSAGLLIFLKLALWNYGRIVSDRIHACSNRTAQPAKLCIASSSFGFTNGRL